MRPKNVKFPFTWEERKPLFHEGIFIVPQCYEEHSKWKDEEGIFSRSQSFSIEYCSGNGDWIIEKALQNPNRMWIAVEKQFQRVQKIWSKRQNHRVENLLIVCGEALTFTQFYLPEAHIDEVFINFPDPWPKKRHAKHRLIQRPFVEVLARILKPSGTATLVTDDASYSQQMIEEMVAHPAWKATFPEPYFKKNWENYGSSWFGNLWYQKGREFYYMQFVKHEHNSARCSSY